MTKHSPITWTTIQIPLGDLQEWDKNPVKISERDARELAKSIDRFEHVLPYVAAAPMNGKKELPLLDGHQRKMVEITLRKANPKTLVDVRVPSRKLSDKERAELVVRLRKNTGEFDFDKLADFFEADDLEEWGFQRYELSLIGFEFEGIDPNEEWEGMPEFEQEDLSAMKSVIVHFATQADVDKFAMLVKQGISEKTKSIWYPKAKLIDMKNVIYHDKS